MIPCIQACHGSMMEARDEDKHGCSQRQACQLQHPGLVSAGSDSLACEQFDAHLRLGVWHAVLAPCAVRRFVPALLLQSRKVNVLMLPCELLPLHSHSINGNDPLCSRQNSRTTPHTSCWQVAAAGFALTFSAHRTAVLSTKLLTMPRS